MPYWASREERSSGETHVENYIVLWSFILKEGRKLQKSSSLYFTRNAILQRFFAKKFQVKSSVYQPLWIMNKSELLFWCKASYFP